MSNPPLGWCLEYLGNLDRILIHFYEALIAAGCFLATLLLVAIAYSAYIIATSCRGQLASDIQPNAVSSTTLPGHPLTRQMTIDSGNGPMKFTLLAGCPVTIMFTPASPEKPATLGDGKDSQVTGLEKAEEGESYLDF
ncbi:hypothetical protein JAAARDRAFT_191937 [Jaapia argillacea MUCL 33604]|uniref:Uncharacterized protein n=1 Tax=Jaapia argillacea MUCL 33604 TaxID=933084 RepID=A0A067PZW5_9AGAM|nr:hypothetical protein JAAARDRAFT_191937 [Jaapia argillacea MUCL 33604]